MSHEKDGLEIKSGKTKFKLRTLPASDMILMKFEGQGDVVPGIIDAIKCVMSRQSDELSRAVLCGVYFDGANDAIVATDGKAASVVPIELQSNAIVPSATIKSLAKMEGEVSVAFAENSVRFSSDYMEITSKTFDGGYPNWKAVIPQQTPEITIDVESLKSAIRRASVVCKEPKSCAFEFAKDCISISARNGEDEARTEVDADCKATFAVAFNPDVITKILDSCTGEKVAIGFDAQNPSISPVTIFDGAARHIAMPMRIQS
jgi:DNA polymerase-3 subunit beta